jgi:ammonium transporter, Amt family
MDSGDNAWVMVSGCLVMFMTPGVGFFYGGMVNKKNLLSTIAYCLLVFCIATITWALLGFSLAFGNNSSAAGFIGDCVYCGLRNLSLTLVSEYSTTIPLTTFFFFQTMFAAITPAIFIGSVIGRIRIPFLIIITIAFNIIVYAPIAFWMWNHEGWLFKMGAIDFAGGNVIHIPAGFAGLASAVYLGHGEKKSYKQNSSSISLTLIGTAILWVGWFGFNGGSALSAGQLAAVAITNSHLAACAAGLGWAGVQYLVTKQPSIVGWCCGAVCGLVAITPAAGYVSLWSSLIIGALGGVFSYLFCHAKSKHFEELADTLDVFGCHGISAIWGGIATGLFATTDSGNTYNGAFYLNGRQLGVNILAIVCSAAYSFAMTWLLYFLLGKVMDAKVTEEEEH